MRTRVDVLIDGRLKVVDRELAMVNAAITGLSQALEGKVQYRDNLLAEQAALLSYKSPQ